MFTCSPKHFNLEQRKIEQTYWNLQKRLHPDLYGSKSEVRLTGYVRRSLREESALTLCRTTQFEQELSTTNAAVINDAYKMLKKPNTRVKYLVGITEQHLTVQSSRLHCQRSSVFLCFAQLALHGIDALGETASTAVDPELLMQTMELRYVARTAPMVSTATS